MPEIDFSSKCRGLVCGISFCDHVLTYLFSLKIKYGERILRMHFLQIEREGLDNTTRINCSLHTKRQGSFSRSETHTYEEATERWEG